MKRATADSPAIRRLIPGRLAGSARLGGKTFPLHGKPRAGGLYAYPFHSAAAKIRVAEKACSGENYDYPQGDDKGRTDAGKAQEQEAEYEDKACGNKKRDGAENSAHGDGDGTGDGRDGAGKKTKGGAYPAASAPEACAPAEHGQEAAKTGTGKKRGKIQ
jgi:hypothetical protein